jgi:hypothetical protein
MAQILLSFAAEYLSHIHLCRAWFYTINKLVTVIILTNTTTTIFGIMNDMIMGSKNPPTITLLPTKILGILTLKIKFF